MQKYNYWNSNYIASTERYCQLKELYFWLSGVANGIGIKVERAKGSTSTTWETIYDSGSSFAMTGWSGNDYISFAQNQFGGYTTQPTNYWNYRLTMFTRAQNGGTTLSTSSNTTAQSIMEIRGYGDTWWQKSNEYMANDKMYTHDAAKNVAFPAQVNATQFNGNINWSYVTNKPTIPSYTAGDGISITNGVISVNYPNADTTSY